MKYVVACALLLFAVAAPKRGERISGTVVRVADGDTVTLRVEEEKVIVRLSGIDAPEDGQDFSQPARRALVKKVLNKEVSVLIRDTDKYGRTVGVIFLDGHCVNTELVEEGLAWHYVEYEKSKTLSKAEAAARVAKAGLWSDAHPLPPWEWREMRRSEQKAKALALAEQSKAINEAKGKEKAADTSKPVNSQDRSEPSKTRAPPAYSHWLNTATGVRHNNGCRYYKNTKNGRVCGANEGKSCGICGG